MIEYVQGDILRAQCEAIVNTVNCMGVMGRGIALQFRNTYPANYKSYRDACGRGEVVPGRMFVFPTGSLVNPRYIINFPTKLHWQNKSQMQDIDAGLLALAAEIRRLEISSIAIPPLECGNGGLDWNDVGPRIAMAMEVLDDTQVLIYAPGKQLPTVDEVPPLKRPPMTRGRAVLIGLMAQYLEGYMDPHTSLLEVHKLLYFMQIAGEPLSLRFAKGHYGPYAENLKYVLAAINSYFITGYSDDNESPNMQINLVGDAVDLATKTLELDRNSATMQRLKRVAKLIDGFEAPYGLELLSTVHWVVVQEQAQSICQAEQLVHSWNERKQKMSSRDIELAWRVIGEQGWFTPSTAGDCTHAIDNTVTLPPVQL